MLHLMNCHPSPVRTCDRESKLFILLHYTSAKAVPFIIRVALSYYAAHKAACGGRQVEWEAGGEGERQVERDILLYVLTMTLLHMIMTAS